MDKVRKDNNLQLRYKEYCKAVLNEIAYQNALSTEQQLFGEMSSQSGLSILVKDQRMQGKAKSVSQKVPQMLQSQKITSH